MITTLPAPLQLKTGYRFLDPALRFVSTLAWLVVQLPWYAMVKYPAVLFIAVTAAYASAQVATHQAIFPFPLNWALGTAFELVYLGAIALSGSKRDRWFFAVVASGALTSVTYIATWAAMQYHLVRDIQSLLSTEAAPWLKLLVDLYLIFIHSVPLTILAVTYLWLIHTRRQDEEINLAHEARLNANACPYGCGRRFETDAGKRGHMGQCLNRPKE